MLQVAFFFWKFSGYHSNLLNHEVMKKYQLFGFIIVVTLLINYNLFGQNPNWTLPPKVYKPQSGIVALPNPAGGYPTEYQGEISTNLHGAYSDRS